MDDWVEHDKVPWFSFLLPWEQPKLFRGRRKWRKLQERIFWLERELGYADRHLELYEVFPWRTFEGW